MLFRSVSFTSYTYDVVLDLYFAQARFYDQNTRRFISIDPIKDGVNWYAYCGNNPVVFVDPSGLVIVFIDPGHGGSELGARGLLVLPTRDLPGRPFIPLLLNEKDMNLDIAQRVSDILEANDITVIMSRTTDVDILPDERAKLANESNADLFVSIHHNSSSPFKSGTMVIYPLLERHGERSDISKQIAENINNLVSTNTGLKNLGVSESNLRVLNLTNMPAILTETGYMGTRDIQFLLMPENRQKVAESIAEGIMSYVSTLTCK